MICSVSRLSGRKPGSTARTVRKLRSSRPAPSVSTTASATSDTTSAARSRRWPRPDVDPRPDAFSVDWRSGREAASAGTRPMPRPVTSDSAKVKPSTARSGCTSPIRGMSPGASATSAVMPQSTVRIAMAPPMQGQQQRFDQRLRDQPAPPRAERRAHRHLALARGAAREQQVRQVDARHQQDHSDAAEQQQQRGTHAADRLVVQRHDRRADRAVGVAVLRRRAAARCPRLRRSPARPSRPA